MIKGELRQENREAVETILRPTDRFAVNARTDQIQLAPSLQPLQRYQI